MTVITLLFFMNVINIKLELAIWSMQINFVSTASLGTSIRPLQCSTNKLSFYSDLNFGLELINIIISGHPKLKDSGLCHTLHCPQAGLCWGISQALLNTLKNFIINLYFRIRFDKNTSFAQIKYYGLVDDIMV